MQTTAELTGRQREIWSFLVEYVDRHGYPPTVREIGGAVGLASPSTVHAHLANLDLNLLVALRELVRERTALKRQASRAKGTKFGRPRKVHDSDHIATAKRMKADGHTGRDIAKYLGVAARRCTGTSTSRLQG